MGPALFTAPVVYLGSLTPGYSQLTQAISDLGATGAPNAVIQDLNFLLLGVLILAFSAGLQKGIGDGRGSALGPFLMGISALGIMGWVLPLRF